jgi:hypothetical protein
MARPAEKCGQTIIHPPKPFRTLQAFANSQTFRTWLLTRLSRVFQRMYYCNRLFRRPCPSLSPQTSRPVSKGCRYETRLLCGLRLAPLFISSLASPLLQRRDDRDSGRLKVWSALSDQLERNENRSAAHISQQLSAETQKTQEMLAKLLALLEAGEADKFAAHLYQSRRQYRLVCERPNNGNKAIEREVISSYQVAQSLGFNGDFRA